MKDVFECREWINSSILWVSVDSTWLCTIHMNYRESQYTLRISFKNICNTRIHMSGESVREHLHEAKDSWVIWASLSSQTTQHVTIVVCYNVLLKLSPREEWINCSAGTIYLHFGHALVTVMSRRLNIRRIGLPELLSVKDFLIYCWF